MKIETIDLKEFGGILWEGVGIDVDVSAASVVEQVRNREGMLRRWLPAGVVHRLDACFGRSNTVHPDTGKALYALARLSKAKNIIETGTYWGYSTSFLAAGVASHEGKVWSFDDYPYAGKHIPKSLRRFVELKLGRPSTEMLPEVLSVVSPDLFFQDSRHDYEGVAEELRVVRPHLRADSVVLFHDFVLPEVRQAAVDVLDGFEVFVLSTTDPQQLGIAFQRPQAPHPSK